MFLGVYALAPAVAGFMFAPIDKVTRGLLLVCAALSIVPEAVTDLIGIALLVVLIMNNRRQMKKHKAETATA